MPLTELEVSIEIKRPLKEVVAFVDDCNNDPMWQSSVLESEKVTDGKPVVGTIYHVKEKFLGRVIEQQWQVTERNADGSDWSAKTLSGSFPMKTTLKMEAAGDGTRITRRLSIDVGHFFKVATPVVSHIAQRELEMDFANLKELLESGI